MRCPALLLALALLAPPATVGAVTQRTGEFQRIAETRHARFYSVRGSKTNIDVARTEAFLERLFALFGPPPPGWRLEYYRHSSVAGLSAALGFAAEGATDLDRLRIDSVRAYHPHELVHAVVGRLGRPPLVFIEGLAVALTSEGRIRGRDNDEVARDFLAAHGSLRPLLTDFALEDPARDYAVAGSFVAYLLDRYGIDAMAAFLRACGTDAEQYERALLSAYGGGLPRLVHEWGGALRTTPAPSREWYDARRWPAALQRPGAVQVASAADAPLALDSRAVGAAPALVFAPGP